MRTSARAARQAHFYARTWHCSVNKGKNPADLQMGVDGTAIGQKTKGGDEQLRAEESPSHFLAPSPSLIVSSVGFRLGGCPLSSSPLCCLLGRPASRPLASVGLAYQTDKGKDKRRESWSIVLGFRLSQARGAFVFSRDGTPLSSLPFARSCKIR